MSSKRFRWPIPLCLAGLAVVLGGWSLLAQRPVPPPSGTDAQKPTGPKKVAFLVGMNHYLKRGFDDLHHAERDMEELGEILQNNGFRVVLLTGSAKEDPLRATRRNIEEQLNRLLEDVEKTDVVLVAFSGHGQQLKVKRGEQERDDSFFCPVDAVAGNAATQFSLSYLIDDVLAKKGGKNLILVDACRNRPKDPGRGAKAVKGVQERSITLPEQTAVLFSCRAEQRSFEQPEEMKGGHGLFTLAVLEALRGKAAVRGKVTWSNLVSYVEDRLADEEFKRWMPEEERQTPLPAGNLTRTTLLEINDVMTTLMRRGSDEPLLLKGHSSNICGLTFTKKNRWLVVCTRGDGETNAKASDSDSKRPELYVWNLDAIRRVHRYIIHAGVS